MIIGIPAFGSPTVILNKAYIDYIHNSGFTPLIINEHNSLSMMADMCDGLLLPGGGDLDPIYYYDNNSSAYNVNPEKDNFERNLMYEFKDSEKPIFAICRGFQLMAREFVVDNFNVELSYYQHISGHSQTGDKKAARNIASHFVRYDIDSLYGDHKDDVNGIDIIAVNSMHHQGIVLKDSKVEVGDTLIEDPLEIIITAVAYNNTPSDTVGIVEGLEIPSMKISGVQWHPEELNDVNLLRHAMEKYKNE